MRVAGPCWSLDGLLGVRQQDGKEEAEGGKRSAGGNKEGQGKGERGRRNPFLKVLNAHEIFSLQQMPVVVMVGVWRGSWRERRMKGGEVSVVTADYMHRLAWGFAACVYPRTPAGRI
jgi:hypothetical protein